MLKKDSQATICSELQGLQRRRSVVMKSRMMQDVRLQHVIAGTLGYESDLSEANRKRMFSEARRIIKEVGEGSLQHEYSEVILPTLIGIDAFNKQQKLLERQMRKLVRKLPVAKWIEQPEQNGVSLQMLAVIIGETGDLSNYDRPCKMWKRMGCAPHTFRGKTRMGSTWRSGKEGKLPSGEWEDYGYCPRRRSISYLVGEGLVKQNFIRDSPIELEDAGADEGNKDRDIPSELDAPSAVNETGTGEARIELDSTSAGPYRARYDEAKRLAAENHPEWTRCSKCGGGGCSNCKQSGRVMMRCHLHGMLLATKRFYKELWIEWQR